MGVHIRVWVIHISRGLDNGAIPAYCLFVQSFHETD
jgi:hypothetical protein